MNQFHATHIVAQRCWTDSIPDLTVAVLSWEVEDLIKQLLAHINTGNVSINKTKIAKKLKADIERFHKLRSEVLHQEYLSGNLGEIENSAVKTNDDEMAIDYLKHILKTGSSDDRREALGMIRTKFMLRNKELKVA